MKELTVERSACSCGGRTGCKCGPKPKESLYKTTHRSVAADDLKTAEAHLLHLQCAAGNRAVSSLVGGLAPAALRAEDGYPANVGGANATLQRLTAQERTVDLQSDRFRDDARLQQAFDNAPLMRRGERGEAVAKVQQALLDLNFLMPKSTNNGTSPPDGVFGEETQSRLRTFQGFNGLTADGVVGRQTLGTLERELTGISPSVPGAAPPAPAPAATITANDVSPQVFSGCGIFDWSIAWDTTGRDGFIVQEIINTYNPVNCADASPNPDNHPVPRYWEAWRVDSTGRISPQINGVHDLWHRVNRNNPPQSGNWHMTGNVFFVDQLDLSAGFVFGGVRDAGILLSTTTQPTNLGSAVLTRDAGGRWDCCGDTPTHDPE